jgi:hypothetical protein
MTSNAIERTTTASPVALPSRIGQGTAVEQSRAVAEVQAAIIVAQQCPRDMVRAWAEMRAACGRLALASRAFYTVTNRGTGPSVHLARELARIWGNIDYGVKELRRDDEASQSEIQAYAWDQQTNVRSTRLLIVPHARMKRVRGEHTRELLIDLTDVYLNNQNVGARATRECIFTVLPADFVAEAQEICRATIEKGDGQPLDKRIASMIEAFAGFHVTVGQIEAKVGRKRGLWTAVDLADLSVVFSSIKRGEISAEEAFPPERITADEIVGTQANRDAIQRLRRDPQPEASAEEKPPSREETVTSVGAPRGATDKQIGMINAIAPKVGLADRDLLHHYVSEAIGRTVNSLKELTNRDASTVIGLMQDLEKREQSGGAS